MYSSKSISIKTQRLPIFAPGISPARAFSCSVTGWILSRLAAACRVSVLMRLLPGAGPTGRHVGGDPDEADLTGGEFKLAQGVAAGIVAAVVR